MLYIEFKYRIGTLPIGTLLQDITRFNNYFHFRRTHEHS